MPAIALLMGTMPTDEQPERRPDHPPKAIATLPRRHVAAPQRIYILDEVVSIETWPHFAPPAVGTAPAASKVAAALIIVGGGSSSNDGVRPKPRPW